VAGKTRAGWRRFFTGPRGRNAWWIEGRLYPQHLPLSRDGARRTPRSLCLCKWAARGEGGGRNGGAGGAMEFRTSQGSPKADSDWTGDGTQWHREGDSPQPFRKRKAAQGQGHLRPPLKVSPPPPPSPLQGATWRRLGPLDRN